ncbi:MAG: hypothetical protein P8Y70_00095 [Candidatus Lokiarchaeota archaeon]
MSSLGAAIFAGNSKLFLGPMGMVQIGFKGYDCGKTTTETNLVPDQDIKDIMYQQDGSKAADHVRTGQDLLLNCTFGEIKTGLLELMMAGITSTNTNPNDDSGVIGRSLYQSMRDNEAGGLKIASILPDGTPSEELEDMYNFYEAIPVVNGDLVNWGADTQRNFPIQFRIKYHKFSSGESSTHNGAFGYWGDPTIEDVPAITYPDLTEPSIVSAVATLATNMDITFDKNIAFQSAWDATDYVVNVEGDGFSLSTAGNISGAVLSLTFGAGTFADNDIITVSISSKALEDTEATPNEYSGIDGYPCTETI